MKKLTVILLTLISITLGQDNNMSFGFRINVSETNPISSREPQIFESSFSYLINEKLAITANFSHASSTDERNYINTQSPQNNVHLKSDLTINMISLGAKFFIKDREESKVNPFIIASFDKYFASASVINSQFPSGDFTQSIKNFEDENSPLFIGIGIGTEYFFNTDFSLVTSLEDKFLSYQYSYRNNINQYSYTEETYKISRSYFKLTVGFNFYF